jgi:hypothetical protein
LRPSGSEKTFDVAQDATCMLAAGSVDLGSVSKHLNPSVSRLLIHMTLACLLDSTLQDEGNKLNIWSLFAIAQGQVCVLTDDTFVATQ